MKRTKEIFCKDHPDWTNLQGQSGCKEFQGEDLCKLNIHKNMTPGSSITRKSKRSGSSTRLTKKKGMRSTKNSRSKITQPRSTATPASEACSKTTSTKDTRISRKKSRMKISKWPRKKKWGRKRKRDKRNTMSKTKSRQWPIGVKNSNISLEEALNS